MTVNLVKIPLQRRLYSRNAFRVESPTLSLTAAICAVYWSSISVAALNAAAEVQGSDSFI